jgi:hypothetical protein
MFYKTQSLTAALVPALHTALNTEPTSLTKHPHEVALDMAKEVKAKVGGDLAVGRVVGAFVLLGLILAVGIWSEHYPDLKRWTDVLYDAFKFGLPALVGLILGEGAAKSS